MTTFRTGEGGRIDRTTTLEFTFDGQAFTGHPGDTLASALLAAGRHQIATSVKLGRPRGVAAAWAEDPCGLVQIEEPFPEPMLLATTVELYDGLVARGLPGQGRLADIPDSARYDAVHHHVDVLVVGAGPAGLAAALSAARAGARVALVDEQSEAGGSLLSDTARLDGAPAPNWPATRRFCACSAPPPSAATTTAWSWRWSGAPTTSGRPRPGTCPASGCGVCGPARWSSRPGPTSARSCSPTTTAPASCSPAPPGRSCTVTA